MTWKEMRFAGWGRTAWSTSRVSRPETLASLRAVAREPESLVRGAGRSYGDQAQCVGGHVILTERLNRFLAFDAESGLLVAEAGVTFTDLLSTFLPRGWIAPVTPGTGFVTLGGALANDVHGKNHDHDGSFGRHVEWFDLLTADGEILRITPDGTPDLFNATVGGMGLTGIVTSLALRMRKAASAGHGALARDLDAREGALNVFAAFGTMPRQAAAEADPALAVDTIAVNFAGMVSILLHLAPLLERRRCGRVVVLGSVAGDRGRLSNYVYGSTKAGLHAFLQGLRARLARAGISVATVKPGFTDTAMTWGMPGMFLVASPEAVARRCFEQAVKGTEEIYVPAFWWLIMVIIRAIPEQIFKRLNL